MPQPRLLNAPARRLLLTFVVTAGMAVAVKAAPSQGSARSANSHRATTSLRSRARQTVDYSRIEGVLRWGLND